MDTSRFESYLERVRGALRLAVSEDHPPRLIALSFAFGIFVSTLPNFGVSILVLAWIGRRFEWANKFAFFAAIGILNPLVKGGIYVMSYFLGVQLLGPVPGITGGDLGRDVGAAVVVRLLVGNVLLAICLTVVGYVVAYLIARELRQHG